MKRTNNFLTVMKKELRRFFTDRRMLMTMILPGILIFVIYSFMGETLVSQLAPGGDHVYTVAAENLPASVESLVVSSGVRLVFVPASSAENAKSAVADQSLDLYAIFPPDFDEAVAAYTPASGKPAPEVRLYYNSASTSSGEAYGIFTGILDSYESSLANRFDINRPVEGALYDLATPEDMTVMLMSLLMPMLLMTLLFTGCMAVATESIAGEKERGTIATLLVTPMRRWELALGKIAALSITALCSGLCSFLGVLFSLPKLMGSQSIGFDTAMYGVVDYIWLLGVILSTILVFVSLISVISALSSSVKAATGMVSPLMLLVTLIGVSGMFLKPSGNLFYLIPVYNSVQCIVGVFSVHYEPVQMIMTIGMNVLLTAGLVALLAKLFSSEKVMFKK